MQRLTAQDAMFLHIEDARNPMHVGSVAILEGPAPRYGDLVRMVVRKLHLVPRYRQRVRFVPLQLARPVWADDPHFQVLYHVRHTAVPPPGGEDELRNLAGRLLAQPLDRSKPLWEIWMVEGLRDGRWAVVCKTHHCLVDGIAGTDLLALLFDRSAHPRAAAAVPWAPAREPGAFSLLGDAWVDALAGSLERLAGAPARLRAPLRTARETVDLVSGLATEWGRFLRMPAPLNGPVGPHRRWAWIKGSLAEVKDIRRGLGGTVNDVVLAAVTHGFRELLLNRGEPIHDRVVRSLVPVSVRTEAERGLLTNRVSGLVADLPVGIDSPTGCLAEITQQMERLKESNQAQAIGALIRLADLAPAASLLLAARVGVVTPQRLVQTVTTNVPGPEAAIFIAGRRMVDYYPYVPIGGDIRIGVAIVSYAGELNFGLTADYDTVPDLDVLRAGIQRGMAELQTAARRRGPRRAKAPAAGTAGTRRTREATATPRPERPAVVARKEETDHVQRQRHPAELRRAAP